MYCKLEPKFTDATMMINKASHRKYSLSLGVKLPVDMPVPMQFKVDTDIEGPYLPASFLPEPVFSVEFIRALRKTGVDNFETVAVTITNPASGTTIDGYEAMNIIGKVACADMDASNSDRLIEDQYIFRNLIIDPSKAKGLNLFRLAEWTQVILIHESVVKQIPPDLARDFIFESVEEI